MKAREYLEGIKKLDDIINSLLKEYDRIKSLASKVTATYEGERVQASGSQEKMADAVVKLVDYQNRINDSIDKYVDMRENIMQVMKTLKKNNHIKVLYKRYYEYKSWQQIADEIKIPKRTVIRIHDKALECMDALLTEK